MPPIEHPIFLIKKLYILLIQSPRYRGIRIILIEFISELLDSRSIGPIISLIELSLLSHTCLDKRSDRITDIVIV